MTPITDSKKEQNRQSRRSKWAVSYLKTVKRLTDKHRVNPSHYNGLHNYEVPNLSQRLLDSPDSHRIHPMLFTPIWCHQLTV